MQTYHRLQPGDDDPERLLDPDKQYTEPWGGTVYGTCDKCGGTGRTSIDCESCKDEPSTSCPVCGGEVHYEGECPACEGSGEIDDSSREGVSVFPDVDGLYRYMIRRGADLDDGMAVVTLEGQPSEDRDFDADEGAMLVNPTRIVSTDPVDFERVEHLRAELAR